MIFYFLLWYILLGIYCFVIIFTMDVIGPRVTMVGILLATLLSSILIQTRYETHFEFFNYSVFFAILIVLLLDKRAKQHIWNKHEHIIMREEEKGK